jgi:hypothetical protein
MVAGDKDKSFMDDEVIDLVPDLSGQLEERKWFVRLRTLYGRRPDPEWSDDQVGGWRLMFARGKWRKSRLDWSSCLP